MTADLSTHPDWLALVRAVCGTPGDDLRRLVAADWLDDNGHGEYAEFIRIQCRLAQSCTACDGEGEYDADHRPGKMECRLCFGRKTYNREDADDLRRRERELGRAYCVHWFAPPPGFVVRWGPGADTSDEVRNGTPLYHVRRGFVSEVRGSLAALLGRPCERCGGEGVYFPDPDVSAVMRCPPCSGTGTTLGVLPRLVGRQPVEAVGVVGKEPAQSIQHDGWWRWFVEYGGEQQAGELPQSVYDLLVGEYPESRHGRSTQPYWRSRESALAALSAAVLKRAREVAKQEFKACGS